MDGLNWIEISLRIKAERKKKKITIERLSEIIGVSPSFIGLVERCDSGISVDNLYKLSCVFGVSMDYLLTGISDCRQREPPSQFNRLIAAIQDYSEEEIDFLTDLAKFFKHRIKIK